MSRQAEGSMDHGKYSHNIENDKRRRALPVSVTADAKFFFRLIQVRKAPEIVFITKAVAKNR